MIWPSSPLSAHRTDEPQQDRHSVFPAPTPKYSSSYAQDLAEGRSRPSTATSTTFSSYDPWDDAPDSECEQRSPSHIADQELMYLRSSASNSSTYHSSSRPYRSYVSPPATQNPTYSTGSQNIASTSSQIPSAQPHTHMDQPSPQVFSMSDPTTPPLPSPPNSQVDDLSSPDWRAKPFLVEPFHDPATAASRQRHTPSTSPDPDFDDSDMLDAVLDGIGRVHVTMDLDEAGRWRIKRPDTHHLP